MQDSYIWPGDIFSIEGKGISGWVNTNLTKTPRGSHTKEFHFGIIGDPIYDENGKFVDFETRESIAKGPSTLRFFDRYTGQSVSLYRLPGITKEESLRAMRSISQIGAAGYGFKDFLACGADVIMLMSTLQFPPYTPEKFCVSRNEVYICTELPAYEANSIHKNIEPPGKLELWDIPVLYLQAIEEDRLIRYYKDNLEDLSRQMIGV
jgi:hypothetical protein